MWRLTRAIHQSTQRPAPQKYFVACQVATTMGIEPAVFCTGACNAKETCTKTSCIKAVMRVLSYFWE